MKKKKREAVTLVEKDREKDRSLRVFFEFERGNIREMGMGFTGLASVIKNENKKKIRE